MKYLARFIIRLAAALALCAHAPTSFATDNELGTWLVISMTDRLPTSTHSGRWRYWFDAQARYSDIGSGNNQLVARPGLGYELGPTLTVWAGYGRFRAHGNSGSKSTEDRFWQQLSWRFRSWEKSSLSMRFRFEQRSVSNGSDIGLVLRAQLKYVREVSTSDRASVVASVEPFVVLRDTDWGARSGVRQHRSYLGVAWTLTNKNTLEVGYQNQLFLIENAENRMRHVAMLNFKTKF